MTVCSKEAGALRCGRRIRGRFGRSLVEVHAPTVDDRPADISFLFLPL
jgi:hypothetical protein